MMDIKDARKIIKDLSEKPFICSEHCIETESGYVITTKDKQKYARSKKQTNADRIRNMSDDELASFLIAMQISTKVRNRVDSKKEIDEYLQAEVKEGGSDAS